MLSYTTAESSLDWRQMVICKRALYYRINQYHQPGKHASVQATSFALSAYRDRNKSMRSWKRSQNSAPLILESGQAKTVGNNWKPTPTAIVAVYRSITQGQLKARRSRLESLIALHQNPTYNRSGTWKCMAVLQ